MLVVSAVLLLSACGDEHRCPDGWTEDPARVRGLPVLEPVEATVCWGPQLEGGARDTEGRLLLDPTRDDRWLAARIAHLKIHGRAPDAGPDCLASLLREEARAWSVELRRRRELGVTDSTCPVETTLGRDADVAAIAAWLRDAPHPRARGLRVSHARRCGW